MTRAISITSPYKKTNFFTHDFNIFYYDNMTSLSSGIMDKIF